MKIEWNSAIIADVSSTTGNQEQRVEPMRIQKLFQPLTRIRPRYRSIPLFRFENGIFCFLGRVEKEKEDFSKMRPFLKIAGIGIALVLIANLMGCAGVDKIPPLELPSSEITNGLKSYNRYTFKGNQSTDQSVTKGDMVLIFASGAGDTSKIKGLGFKVKIGKNPSINPLNQIDRGGVYFGYFMASLSGKLNLFYKYTTNAGIHDPESLYCKADVFVLPESSEPDLFDILNELIQKNPEDDVFRSQVEQFIFDYQWLIYTKIEIQSAPSFANVYLDEQLVGKTPLELDKINKHRAHSICVKLSEYSEHCESFSPKEKSRFNIVLEKIPAAEQQNIAKYTYKEDKDPPLIEIKEPQMIGKNNVIEISNYQTMISGNVKDENGVVWVKINGANANLDTQGDFWLTTPLAVGLNNIEIHALDTKNNLAKKTVIIERSPIRASEDLKSISAIKENIDFGQYSALVIGNNAYEKMPQLRTAVSDAKSLAQVLENLYGFKIDLILNGTRHEILFALDKFRSKLNENDNFLIYYAGHGYFDKEANRGYWLPINADTDTTAEWISNADITDKLTAIKAKHIMVIADSCYSGTLTRGVKVVSRDSGYLLKMAQKRTRTVLTSGGLEPVLDSAGGDHSVFAKALLNALKGNNSVIDGTALFGEIRRPVMLNAPQTPQYSDIRFAGHEGGDFLFVRNK